MNTSKTGCVTLVSSQVSVRNCETTFGYLVHFLCLSLLKLLSAKR
jgi:hypothetical protein